VTGGPGTGKTTTINGILSAYEKQNPNKVIRLCAPTGRAAQRMTESTGREAVTIHRLLEYKPYGNEVTYKNANDKLEADLIVVDEASMLDMEFASIFFSAVPTGALVLIVGDIHQLPSVGPGDVLHDMISPGMIPTVQLTTVYRQGSHSPIIQNAIRIHQGIIAFMENEEYQTYITYSQTELARKIIACAVSMHNKNIPFETQILCPSHKGEAGVGMLNTALQSLLNPGRQGLKELKYGNTIYRSGDKVILLNNNYQNGYFNGDIGIIKDISDAGIHLNIFGSEIIIAKTEIDDLGLAYAMTIHKSQGSEFKNIIVSLPMSPKSMLKRNLLYTAITRAKKTVIVVTEKQAVSIAVKTCETGKRNSRLALRIKEEFQKSNGFNERSINCGENIARKSY